MNARIRSILSQSFRTVAATLTITLLSNQFALASIQTPHPAPQDAPLLAAPVPTQIATAHAIFLVNSGADANFPISGDDSYNRIYAALKAWGFYQLVSTPAQADLIFNLRDIAPITDIVGNRGGTYSIASPAFQLTITDPKTNVALWTITSPAPVAGRKQARAYWVDIAITNLVSRTKVLAKQQISATESADLTLMPKSHAVRNILILTGAAVGVGLTVGLVLRHEFDQNVKNQNASLCAQNPVFCNTPTP